MSSYFHLFSPFKIGQLELANRIVMGSMHTGFEARRWDREKLAAFYVQRVKGGVGLIITGGIAPSRTGLLTLFDAKITNYLDVSRFRLVTKAVHSAGGKIVLQLLHAGRYGATPLKLGVSHARSPIHPFQPIKASDCMIKHVIRTFARAAQLAYQAGFDGVEIMAGEGYFINQFLCPRTNDRTDQWGGTTEKRQRFLLEIIRAIRAKVPASFALILRQSLADLVEGGQTEAEIIQLAKKAEALGIDAINTDIGWHESRIPTIVTSVPRAAFVHFTERLRSEVTIPLIASNRINEPQLAETILARGLVDAVSMARPLLADPALPQKAKQGRSEEINTCIACNQACLDHAFVGKKVSCLVNPRAGRETTLVLIPTPHPKRVAVVGAGPAGLAATLAAVEKGHHVELFEAEDHIGGQWCLATKIPGKEEFQETIRYFETQLKKQAVQLHMRTHVSASDLLERNFDVIIIATGVKPRVPQIPGVDHPMVLTYSDVLSGKKVPGKRVAIIGAGGIGFAMAEFLTTEHSPTLDLRTWEAEWGLSQDLTIPGFIVQPQAIGAARKVYLLQRTPGKMGQELGKTTAWVHKASLQKRQVQFLSGVEYQKIDDVGLHLISKDESRTKQILDLDNVVLCAGQLAVNELVEPLRQAGACFYLIGGAEKAAAVDAKRAIHQGVETAAKIK
ncbi:MAG: NADPH-dependent 2,4-dienoyl-CoA reductase [Neisseriaceae bacterium]